MTRAPHGPTELLASLPAHLRRTLDPPELLLIGWADDEPDLAVVVGHDLDDTEADDELRAVRQLVVDGAEQAAVVVVMTAAQAARAIPNAAGLARFAAACCDRYGLDLLDVLVVVGDRWRSLACTDPTCCPPEGKPMPHRQETTTP